MDIEVYKNVPINLIDNTEKENLYTHLVMDKTSNYYIKKDVLDKYNILDCTPIIKAIIQVI